MLRTLAHILAAAALACIASAAGAQGWPARPVTMVVPFTAGTTSDVVARALVDDLSKAIGQPVTVDNRGGAGGNIGAAAVAKAKPDGYTILLATTGPAATNKLMYKSLSFDPQRDFADIVLVGKAPVIIVARSNAPVSSLEELIDYAKANPASSPQGFPATARSATSPESFWKRALHQICRDPVSRQHGDHDRPARRSHRSRHGFDGTLCEQRAGRQAARPCDGWRAPLCRLAGCADCVGRVRY